MEIIKNKLVLAIIVIILIVIIFILILNPAPIHCRYNKTCWDAQLRNCVTGASYLHCGSATVYEGGERPADCEGLTETYKIFPIDYNYKIIGRETFGQNNGLCKVEKYTITALYSGSSTTGPEIEYYKDLNVIKFPVITLNCVEKECWENNLNDCLSGTTYTNGNEYYDSSNEWRKVKNVNHKIVGGIFSFCLVEEQIYETIKTKENIIIDSETKFYSNYSLYNNSELVKFFN